MNINLRRLAMWLVIVLLLLISFSLFQTQRTRSRDISFSQLLEENRRATTCRGLCRCSSHGCRSSR